jgi:hypothetical protein
MAVIIGSDDLSIINIVPGRLSCRLRSSSRTCSWSDRLDDIAGVGNGRRTSAAATIETNNIDLIYDPLALEVPTAAYLSLLLREVTASLFVLCFQDVQHLLPTPSWFHHAWLQRLAGMR